MTGKAKRSTRKRWPVPKLMQYGFMVRHPGAKLKWLQWSNLQMLAANHSRLSTWMPALQILAAVFAVCVLQLYCRKCKGMERERAATAKSSFLCQT